MRQRRLRERRKRNEAFGKRRTGKHQTSPRNIGQPAGGEGRYKQVASGSKGGRGFILRPPNRKNFYPRCFIVFTQVDGTKLDDPSFSQETVALMTPDRTIARHSHTTFVVLHLANWPENLDYDAVELGENPT